MIFGQTTPVDSDRKCKFHRFFPARSDCNDIAHGILSCYKMYSVSPKTKYGDITKNIFIPAWSEETLLFDLNLHIKNSLLLYEFSKCRLGWKSISVHSLYTNEVTDCLKPAGISLASIHQHLKNNANPCVCSIRLVSKSICIILTVQTSFVYLLRWGF